jgi:A/G-specific adenine glycosylase
VLHLWSGLGYYARARNLHRAAGIIRDQFAGELPTGMDDIESLPGIGRSTAGAILALSSNRSHAILDGNVRRVLARIFLVEGWSGQAAVNRELWALAEACTPKKRAGNYTQAIMDFGASVCTRRNAACGECPVVGRCAAHRNSRVADIPAPRPRKERPQREVVLVMVVKNGAVLLQKRPTHGVWGGLWSFPEAREIDSVSAWCERRVGISPDRIEVRPKLRHSFTHFDLDMTPVEAHISEPPGRVSENVDWLWFKLHRPAAVGLAAPVSRLLASLGE